MALQRLNGSAKKVKGSLEDKTIRMPMDNAIFRKLMSAVIHPSRSKDWFALAEQAINTVYANGEVPDEFCNDLIKRLTMRAFARPPSGADADGAPASAASGSGHSGEDGMDEDQHPADQTQALDEGSMNTDAPPTISTRGPSQGPSASAPQSKDLGDAFELSQLLFVVGHVAIKHIAFLELIEREWKRQKESKLAGSWLFIACNKC